ncbi:TPA: hypothetical protein JBG74_10520 [Legionella pneumophila]|uniref:Uncharacterized protein n=1 Tax=Legionella pneumophila TaxID=446 RepID=A0A378K1L4_LEGPN|nr:hypothetical protein lpa_01006 [Legionella pneumophila 2300/99 Alcoy]AGN13543.1 hypothetical protein LP6_0626 [Legionella pneumophila subsp. pneumophila str. Thunder Bay]ANH12076.1 hypothetical protein A5478_03225 [Legionella pneumophila]OOD04646.1 hypothetical protein BWO97_14125 [Legionella pneumophila subsp. pneumophila ATCC 43290]HAT8684300.1 hypothetical protein [Legionella pneumophila subsp. pneumophila ATCC 43283]HAT8826388.1 hypothetical protein [Legionella pneumophila subsp. pneumo
MSTCNGFSLFRWSTKQFSTTDFLSQWHIHSALDTSDKQQYASDLTSHLKILSEKNKKTISN